MKNLLSRFVDTNEREIRRLRPILEEINDLEPELQALSDDELRARMVTLREELRTETAPSDPSQDELEAEGEARRVLARQRRKDDAKRLQEALDDALPEVFAAAREVSRRRLEMRPFDVQLMGAMVLHQGKIAEMRTGEGKTLVGAASLPRSTRCPVEASTWSRSTTTLPSATRSGWVPSSTASG